MTSGPSEIFKDPSKMQRYFKEMNYIENDIISLTGKGHTEKRED